MKFVKLTFALLCLIHSATGQDTTVVTSTTEEMQVLRKQRFIDRYDNVFMNKDPTRHIFKIGVMPYDNWFGFTKIEHGLQAAVLNIGYEYKVLPALSVGINVASRSSGSFLAGEEGQASFSGQVRWYYNMSKRIENGVAANNFSGNFLGISYDRILSYNSSSVSTYPRIGVEWGMQRRFFNFGFIDLGVGAYYHFDTRAKKKIAWSDQVREVYSMDGNRLLLTSRAAIGFSFGDWKKRSDLPYCEVLRCDEVVDRQFTVSWPKLAVGLHSQTVIGNIGFEQKIFPSVSVKAQLNGLLFNLTNIVSDMPLDRYLETEISSAIQLRYYVFQQRLRRTGEGGHDLSGFYLGPQTDYIQYRRSWENIAAPGGDLYTKNWRIGLVAGYQKTLFKRAYIDVSWSLSKSIWSRSEGSTPPASMFRVGFGLRF